jgi:hypothetical protein
VIELTLAWFARFRRLTVRHERRLDILLGFHLLAAGLICFRFVARWSTRAPPGKLRRPCQAGGGTAPAASARQDTPSP